MDRVEGGEDEGEVDAKGDGRGGHMARPQLSPPLQRMR